MTLEIEQLLVDALDGQLGSASRTFVEKINDIIQQAAEETVASKELYANASTGSATHSTVQQLRLSRVRHEGPRRRYQDCSL